MPVMRPRMSRGKPISPPLTSHCSSRVMKTKTDKQRFAACTLLGGLFWLSQAAFADNPALVPSTLLELTLAPRKAYSGRINLTQWQGQLARSEDVQIYFSPVEGSRRDYLSPNGAVNRVLLSTADQERLYLIGQKKIL